jgi:hypothetical protein
MASKRGIAFLLSIVPIFLALLWLWQSRGLDVFYHARVASLVNLVYPRIDPFHVVREASVDSDEFVIRLLANGRRTSMYVNAQDITWNLAMMVSLYIASATWHRRFWLWFVGSVAALVVIHVGTVMTIAHEGLLTNPEIASGLPRSAMGEWLVIHYNRFYEELGVHLLVIGLWLPYVMTLLRPRVGAGRGEAVQPH